MGCGPVVGPRRQMLERAQLLGVGNVICRIGGLVGHRASFNVASKESKFWPASKVALFDLLRFFFWQRPAPRHRALAPVPRVGGLGKRLTAAIAQRTLDEIEIARQFRHVLIALVRHFRQRLGHDQIQHLRNAYLTWMARADCCLPWRT